MLSGPQKIKPNDRVFIAGMTGSGKTWLAQHLLAKTKRLVVIDSKASLGDWNLDEPTDRQIKALKKGKPARYRILPPIVDDSTAWYESLFQTLYYAGDLTLYIDEAYAVTNGPHPNRWLTALYTRGRELGIGVWASAQRPTWIPMFLISEANWIITFRLNVDNDRARIASVAGKQVLQNITDPHGFWLYHVGDDSARYFKEAVAKPSGTVV